MGINTEALQAAENDLKQLMADVRRAMERAQEAIAKVTSDDVTASTDKTSGLPPPLSGS